MPSVAIVLETASTTYTCVQSTDIRTEREWNEKEKKKWKNKNKKYTKVVCVLLSTRRLLFTRYYTTSVRSDSSILLIDRHKLCGHKAITQRMIYSVVRCYVDNAMRCHRTVYDRHEIHNSRKIENKEKNVFQ